MAMIDGGSIRFKMRTQYSTSDDAKSRSIVLPHATPLFRFVTVVAIVLLLLAVGTTSVVVVDGAAAAAAWAPLFCGNYDRRRHRHDSSTFSYSLQPYLRCAVQPPTQLQSQCQKHPWNHRHPMRLAMDPHQQSDTASFQKKYALRYSSNVRWRLCPLSSSLPCMTNLAQSSWIARKRWFRFIGRQPKLLRPIQSFHRALKVLSLVFASSSRHRQHDLALSNGNSNDNSILTPPLTVAFTKISVNTSSTIVNTNDSGVPLFVMNNHNNSNESNVTDLLTPLDTDSPPSSPLVDPLSSSSLTATTPSSSLNPTNNATGNSTQLSSSSLSSSMEYTWNKAMLALALPALVGTLADPLLSLMDTAYVGRVGTTELAALGAATSIFHLAFNAFRATTAATTSLVASALQQEQPEQVNASLIIATDGTSASTSASTTTIATSSKASNDSPIMVQPNDTARQVTSLSLWFGGMIGVAVAVFLNLFGAACLAAMGVPRHSPLYPAGADYLNIRCWAAPVVLLIGVAEGAFRGYGDTMVPLVASVCASAINLVLDPILMFARPFQWGVKGAAAATALSQVGAAAWYGWKMWQRHMLFAPSSSSSTSTSTPSTSNTPNPVPRKGVGPAVKVPVVNKRRIIRTILDANLAMLTKQSSLLLAWTYTTARATRLGAHEVAAHQVALSVWLIFAFILDSPAVAAQVLMGRVYYQKHDNNNNKTNDGNPQDHEHERRQEQQRVSSSDNRHQVQSLVRYFLKVALIQGFVSMLVIQGMDIGLLRVFTPDVTIQRVLHGLMPHLAWQQVLVSLTLVFEMLAVGANQFNILAIGTAFSTVLAVTQMSYQTTVVGLWSRGINTLFIGRLMTALVALQNAMNQLGPADKPLDNESSSTPTLKGVITSM